jgi:hypothetical protein
MCANRTTMDEQLSKSLRRICKEQSIDINEMPEKSLVLASFMFIEGANCVAGCERFYLNIEGE